jgi:hypothetical protein
LRGVVVVQEMAGEFAALKPLMAAQEVGLPIYESAISGRYRQAWLRFFAGMRAARKRGVANGLITQEENLNDLEKKLGETPRVNYWELFTSEVRRIHYQRSENECPERAPREPHPKNPIAGGSVSQGRI